MRIGFVLFVLSAAAMTFVLLDHNVNAAAKEVIEKQVLPMDVPFERLQASSELNNIRQAMQMQTLAPNETLNTAAQAHADYLVTNNESSHDEIVGHLNFTGVKPVDRAFYVGYNASQVSENLSSKNYSAISSVEGLFSAIYHRFGFLSTNIDELGVGVAQEEKNSKNSAFVYVMGNSELNNLCTFERFNGVGKYVYGVCKEKSHRIAQKSFQRAVNMNKQNNPEIIFYPYAGQREVPLAFYAEIPDPLPNHEVSGFPISIEFNDYFFKDVQLDTFRLFKGELEVENVLLMDKYNDPHLRFTDKQYALFPLERLDYDREYNVIIQYTNKGKREEISWKFRTKIPTETLYIVKEKEEEITLKSGKSHMIYFLPLNVHDVVKDLQFPSTVDVQFIDNNTFKLTLMHGSPGSFDIVSDSRTVHVKVSSE